MRRANRVHHQGILLRFCKLLLAAQAAAAFAPSAMVARADIVGFEYFVDAGLPAPGDGVSWATAFNDLNAALAAAGPGTRVRVAGGLYKPDAGSGNRSATFQMPQGVIVEGGYAGSAGPDPNQRDPAVFVTLLSGDIGQPLNIADNSFHVVTVVAGSGAAVLDGLTIAWGNANAGFPDDGGSAIRCLGSPEVRNCIIRDNAGASSGAVHIPFGVDTQFTGCTFSNNSTQGSGGAIYISGGSATVTDCLFSNSTADFAGGAIGASNSAFTISDSSFIDNVAAHFGGAIYHFMGSPQITNCLFRANIQLNDVVLGNDGGGAYYNDRGQPTVHFCVFADNLATDDGGAVFSNNGLLTVQSSRFWNNLAGDYGGAIQQTLGTLIVRDCGMVGNLGFDRGGAISTSNGSLNVDASTIVSNRCLVPGGGGIQQSGGSLAIANSVVWYNRDTQGQGELAQIKVTGAVPAVNYCCVQGWSGFLGGMGNFSANPQLVDLEGPDGVVGTEDDDIRLKPASACINSGDPLVEPGGSVDIDGQPRVMGCRLDLGASEFLVGEAGTGDMNGDGLLDGRDLHAFIQKCQGQGPPAWDCVADLDQSGSVDLADVAILVDWLLGIEREGTGPAPMSY